MTMFSAARFGTHLVYIDTSSGPVPSPERVGLREHTFVSTENVPRALGVLYLGDPPTSSVPFLVGAPGVLYGATLIVDRPDPLRDYQLQIHRGGAALPDVLNLPAGSTSVATSAFTTAVALADELEVLIARTAGPVARSTFRNIRAVLYVRGTG